MTYFALTSDTDTEIRFVEEKDVVSILNNNHRYIQEVTKIKEGTLQSQGFFYTGDVKLGKKKGLDKLNTWKAIQINDYLKVIEYLAYNGYEKPLAYIMGMSNKDYSDEALSASIRGGKMLDLIPSYKHAELAAQYGVLHVLKKFLPDSHLLEIARQNGHTDCIDYLTSKLK